jgi:hypothetical protein
VLRDETIGIDHCRCAADIAVAERLVLLGTDVLVEAALRLGATTAPPADGLART